MGRLPQYRSKNILPPQDTAAQERINLQQRGQQAIGGAISDLGNQMVQADIARTKIRNQNYINETSTKMEGFFDEYQQDMLKVMREDPDIDNPGRREVYEGFLDEKYKEFMAESLKKAPTDRAAEVFSQGAEQDYNRIKKQYSMNFESTFVENSNMKVDDRAKASALKAYRNPTLKTLDLVKQEIAAASTVFDDTMDPRLAKKARDKYNKDAAGAVLDGLIDKNRLNEANKLLKSKKLDNDLGEDGVTTYQKRINALLRARKKKKETYDMLKFLDPWKFLSKKKEMYEPINFASTDAKSFIKRREFIDKMKKKHNIKDLPYWSPLDSFIYQKEVVNAPVEKQMAILSNFSDQTDDIYGDIGKGLVGEHQTALGLLREKDLVSKKLAREVLEGTRLMSINPDTKKPNIPTPKYDVAAKHVNMFLAGSIKNPKALKSITDATVAIAVNRRHNKKQDTSSLSKNDITSVLQEMVGDPVVINESVVLPARDEKGYLSKSEMKSIHDSLTNEILEKAFGKVPVDGTGRKIKAEDSLVNLNYRMVGTTKAQLYYVDIDGNEVPLFMDKKTYKPYIIDFNKLVHLKKEDKGWWW